MVLLKVKISDDDQFVFRTTAEATVEATRGALVEVFNLRQKLRRLNVEGVELAKHGVAKPPDAHGIDTYSLTPPQRGEHYDMDLAGKRDGNACCPVARATLTKTLQEALALTAKSRLEDATAVELRDAVDLIRGAVMIGYPMGLPTWDPVRLLLEDRDDATETYGYEVCAPEEMTLWFAGKEMCRGNLLKAHLGRNENTTAVVRLAKASQGAPSREPAVDEETYKGMLAWSYKRQEEQKALAENEDDGYLDSAWANPTSLKRHLNGTTHIRL